MILPDEETGELVRVPDDGESLLATCLVFLVGLCFATVVCGLVARAVFGSLGHGQ